MQQVRSDEVAAIRKQLDHPVIDGDGHLIEYTPLVRDFLVEIAGEEVAKRFDVGVQGSRAVRQIPVDKRRELGVTRFAWWLQKASLAGNTAFRICDGAGFLAPCCCWKDNICQSDCI